jgi:hypothetical protein
VTVGTVRTFEQVRGGKAMRDVELSAGTIECEDIEPTRGGMLHMPDDPLITFVMPNSRRSSLRGVEVRPYTRWCRK